jgi:multimeric flavodoxin WrbA
MKAILLNGSASSNDAQVQISQLITQHLNSSGYEVEEVLLGEKTIGNCAGDFFCWIRTPGICNIKDDNIAIAESIMKSDLVVYLTPVTFGGYSSSLKQMVDHQIQNISPSFRVIDGETHHNKRYNKYPDFAVIGFTADNDPISESIFKQLVYRNSINYFAENTVCEVIKTNQTYEQISANIKNSLSKLNFGTGKLPKSLTLPFQKTFSPVPINRAVLLVGSPRTSKSTSLSLGGYLFNLLEVNRINTETIYLHTNTRSSEKTEAMLKSIDSADLILLAFPLYVDSLPAPVIKAMEIIAAYRKGKNNPRPQLFTAIANCGFPEAEHNATALMICELFANQAGFNWGGGLSLGGGGMINGTSLSDMGGQTRTIKLALELASKALIEGKPIPQDAQELISKPVIPGWLYRLFGNFGWIQGSKKYNTQSQLKNKPYQRISA